MDVEHAHSADADATGPAPRSPPPARPSQIVEATQRAEADEGDDSDDFYGDADFNYSQYPQQHRGGGQRELDPYYGLETLEYVPERSDAGLGNDGQGTALGGRGAESEGGGDNYEEEEEWGRREEELARESDPEKEKEEQEEEEEGNGVVVPDTEPQFGLYSSHALPRPAPPARGRSSSRDSDKTVLRPSQTDGIDRVNSRDQGRGLGRCSSSDSSLRDSGDREEGSAARPTETGPGAVPAAPAAREDEAPAPPAPSPPAAAPSPGPTPSQLDNAVMEAEADQAGDGADSRSLGHYPGTLMENTLVPTDTDDTSTGTAVPDDDDDDGEEEDYNRGGDADQGARSIELFGTAALDAQLPATPLPQSASAKRSRGGDGQVVMAAGREEGSATSSSPSPSFNGFSASKSCGNHESSSESAADHLRLADNIREETFRALGVCPTSRPEVHPLPLQTPASLPASLPPTPDLPCRAGSQDSSVPGSVLRSTPRSAPHSAPRAAAATVVASSCRSAALHDLLARCEVRGWVRVNRESDCARCPETGGVASSGAGLPPIEALVMDAPPQRSFKYLQALCAGVPIVSTAWLRECERQGERVDYGPHVMAPEGAARAGLLRGLEFTLLRVRDSGAGKGAGADAWRGMGARSGHKRQWAVGDADEQDEEDDEGLPECPIIPIPAAMGAPAGQMGQGDVIWMILKCGGRVTHASTGPRVEMLTAEAFAQRCDETRQRAAVARERERERLARERRERDESMRRRMFDQLTEMPLGCLDSGAPVELADGEDDIEEDDEERELDEAEEREGGARHSSGPRRILLLLSLDRPVAPGPAKRSRAAPGHAAGAASSGPAGRGSLFVARGLQWLLEAVAEGRLPPESDASYDVYVAEV